MRKVIGAAMALGLLFGMAAAAETPVYDSYTYTYWGEPVEAPEGYRPAGVFRAENVGLKAFKEPKDLFVDSRNHLYIVDTGNNRIVELDEDNRLVRELAEFKEGAKILTLSSPSGIFVKENGNMLIADTNNKRIIEVDGEERIVQEYRQPTTDVNFSGIDFLPVKVLADSRDFVYVLCKGLYQGAVSYNREGEFLGYFGTNKVEVTLDVLVSQFWKSIMTQEQIAKMEKTVPEEFTNFDIDEKGFIYTCTELSDSQSNQIKKINPSGTNVMQPNTMIKSAYQNRFGDLDIKYYQGEMIQSRFVDVAYYNDGVIGYVNCLDFTKGRIFQYTAENSRLICIFGGTASQTGTFQNAAALACRGEDILVLDSAKNNVTVFEPTDYLRSIHAALARYEEGDYTGAMACWRTVLARNSNLEMAYAGMGNVCYNQGDYVAAMRYFKRGYDKNGYAKALKYYRKDLITRNFPLVLTVLVVGGGALAVFLNRKRLARLLHGKSGRKGGNRS